MYSTHSESIIRYLPTIPETVPIEVCYWIGSNDVTYSEEYLIYDLKVILGSVGGTTSQTGTISQSFHFVYKTENFGVVVTSAARGCK